MVFELLLISMPKCKLGMFYILFFVLKGYTLIYFLSVFDNTIVCSLGSPITSRSRLPPGAAVTLSQLLALESRLRQVERVVLRRGVLLLLVLVLPHVGRDVRLGRVGRGCLVTRRSEEEPGISLEGGNRTLTATTFFKDHGRFIRGQQREKQ